MVYIICVVFVSLSIWMIPPQFYVVCWGTFSYHSHQSNLHNELAFWNLFQENQQIFLVLHELMIFNFCRNHSIECSHLNSVSFWMLFNYSYSKRKYEVIFHFSIFLKWFHATNKKNNHKLLIYNSLSDHFGFQKSFTVPRKFRCTSTWCSLLEWIGSDLEIGHKNLISKNIQMFECSLYFLSIWSLFKPSEK